MLRDTGADLGKLLFPRGVFWQGYFYPGYSLKKTLILELFATLLVEIKMSLRANSSLAKNKPGP